MPQICWHVGISFVQIWVRYPSVPIKRMSIGPVPSVDRFVVRIVPPVVAALLTDGVGGEVAVVTAGIRHHFHASVVVVAAGTLDIIATGICAVSRPHQICVVASDVDGALIEH